METALAIYEALIQANVPSPAARRVAESLEKDMTSSLATKQDLQHFDQLMATRLDALESRINTRFAMVDARFEAVDARFEAVDARFEAVDARFEAVDARFGAVDDRFSELESRIGLMIQNLESRLIIKLGALMAVLIGVAGTVTALLR
jgi:hypothetical protein